MFFGLFKTVLNDVIGIDLGSHSVKAIAISRVGLNYRVDAIAEALLPKGLIVDNHLQDINKISLILKQLLQAFPANYKKAAIAVTGTDVITKIMMMNATLDELTLERQIEIEAENNIPFSLNEVFIDFEVLGSNDNDPSLNKVLVSAARKEQVLSQVQCINESGLTTTIVDIASHALIRAAKLTLSPEDYNKGIVVVDLGASQMTVNILHQDSIIFNRSKSYGGESCTQMIADRYGYTFYEAENLKFTRQYPVDCEREVLDLFINKSLEHFRSALCMFTNSVNHITVDKVILSGGGLLMPELLEKFRLELDLNIVVAQPYTDFEFRREADRALLQQCGSKYMIALGLALRGAEPCL